MASTLFEEDVVQRTHRNTLQLGLVVRNYDGYSSVDDSEDEEEKIKKGFVRVAWYPKGREHVLPEKKVNLYDRSLMPGDAVRRNQEGSQRGIVRSVNVSCHLQVIRTKQMIYDVRSQDLENIMMYTPSCHVVMGSWIGVVRSIYVQLVVRLKNGARCALSDDSACRLTDIHDTDEEASVFSCDSFFPGQVLRGPATTFKNAMWLSGQQPILSSKANFTVTVEEVNVVELDVHWQTRGLCRYPAGDCTDSNQLQPPPRKVTKDILPCVRPLSYFIAASIQIGDKVMYRVRPQDLVYPKPVPRGSFDCYVQPPSREGSGDPSAGKSDLKPPAPQENVPDEIQPGGGELNTRDDEQRETPQSAEEGSSGENSDLKLTASAESRCLENNVPCVNHFPAKNKSLVSESLCIEGQSGPVGSFSVTQGAKTPFSVTQGAKTPKVLEGEAAGNAAAAVSVGACAAASGAEQQDVVSDLQGILRLRDLRAKKGESAKQKPSEDAAEDKGELLARAEVLKVGLSRDVDLLGELHRELCDASESVTDIAKNFRTLLQRATNESAREISGQVSRLLESHGKLQQQILMTEGLLVDSKKSLKELDDIEMETRGAAATGNAAVGKSLRKIRAQAAKNRSRRKLDEDKDANRSSSSDDDEDEDSSGGSDDSDETDSNASSKGESRRHKVVSSLLQRHTKKQHMRLAPKRRPPPKPLEVDERVCVEVTHTRTLVDVMWQDGTLQRGVVSTGLCPDHQLDDLEFFPGDFVTKNNEDLENVYGLVCRTDHKERFCLVQWLMRPNQQCIVPKPINTEEVSVYELTPHPDFTFNVGDVIVRIADSQHGITAVKKGKPDPKGTSPCTQMGDSATQMGNNASLMGQAGNHTKEPSTQMGNSTCTSQVTQSGTCAVEPGNQVGDCGTQMGDSATQMGNNASLMGQAGNHTKEPSTQMGNSTSQVTQSGTCAVEPGNQVGDCGTQVGDCDAQMGNHVIPVGNPGSNTYISGAQSDNPNARWSISSDHTRTSDALVNNQDNLVCEPASTSKGHEGISAETERLKRHSKYTDTNQSTTNDRCNASAAIPHTCLQESQMLTAGSSVKAPQLDSAVTDLAAAGSITEQQPQTDGVGTHQRGTHDSDDAELANVNRMNLANLKMGPIEAAGGASILENKSPAKILNTQGTLKEAVPCAGQVRWINTNGEIQVAWVDGSECSVLPQDLYKLEEDSDSDWSDNDHDDDNWKDEDESDDSSDSSSSSWETASNASGSDEEANIIRWQTNPSPSPTSPDGDATGSETRGLELLPKNLDETTFEQTFSALSLVEDKMRRINSCANSILEKQTELSHLSPDRPPEKGVGATDAVPKQEAAAGCAPNDESQVTSESAGTSALCTQPETQSLSEQDLSNLDHNSESEMAKAASPTSTSSTEFGAASEKNNSEDEVSQGESNHGNRETCPKAPTEGAAQTATGQACDNFFLMEDVPETHHFNTPSVVFLPEDPKQFSLTIRREMRLLQTSLPQGIKVKGFADRMDLFSVLFEGPSNTPYEDGLFFFDARLPQDYPKSPPIMHYHAYCGGRLNPNLYNDGKVCVSLLGTWTGKGSEMWTSKSNLLQVLVSIQGLILVSEPYYNEAGYEKHRGSQPGRENSRLYNETAVLKMVQSMTLMLTNPPDVFHDETVDFCRIHGFRLVKRIEHWLTMASAPQRGEEPGKGDQAATDLPAFTLLPLSKGFILSIRQALRAYRAALAVAGIPDS